MIMCLLIANFTYQPPKNVIEQICRNLTVCAIGSGRLPGFFEINQYHRFSPLHTLFQNKK